MPSEECSFFNHVPKTRCVSPDLFAESHDPRDYTLRVVEVEKTSDNYSLGFHAGQRFPWKSQDSSSPLPMLHLISGQFPDSGEILNDAQSFHPSGFHLWDINPPKETLHWKKILLLKFDTDMYNYNPIMLFK